MNEAEQEILKAERKGWRVEKHVNESEIGSITSKDDPSESAEDPDWPQWFWFKIKHINIE